MALALAPVIPVPVSALRRGSQQRAREAYPSRGGQRETQPSASAPGSGRPAGETGELRCPRRRQHRTQRRGKNKRAPAFSAEALAR
ncbi:unnamed protein product [Prorocentrum cordatum]|nr:unnamed protein product [Polarella glacialis]